MGKYLDIITKPRDRVDCEVESNSLWVNKDFVISKIITQNQNPSFNFLGNPETSIITFLYSENNITDIKQHTNSLL